MNSRSERKTKMLVTGGSGLVGTYLLPHINDLKYEVYVTSHESPVTYGRNIPLDLSHTENAFATISQLKPDIIVNLAAFTNVDRCEIDRNLSLCLNRDLVAIISKYVHHNKAYFLHVSTDYVFDGNDGNYDEDSQTNPVNWYGATKLQGENEMISKLSEGDWCIARISTPFGFHKKKQSFPVFVIEKLQKNESISVLTDQFTSPTYAKNLAKMLVEIIDRRIKGIIHTAGSSRLSRYEQALKISRKFDLNEGLILKVTTDEMKWKAKRPRDSSLNVSRSNKILQDKPERFDQALEQFAQEIP